MLEMKNMITKINNSKDSFSLKKKLVNYIRSEEITRKQQERQKDSNTEDRARDVKDSEIDLYS